MKEQSGFLNFINTITDIPEEHIPHFNKLIHIKKFDKGEDFISAGQFSKSIGYVKEGLFRYYYANDEGLEFTKGFFPENSLLSSYSAILEKRPSYFTIQALENSEVESINYEQFHQSFSQYPWYNEFLVGMLKKGYVVKEAREREFLLFDAEERYRAFLKRYPTLEKRVKQHIIASYLGIAPESLSRVKRKAGLLA